MLAIALTKFWHDTSHESKLSSQMKTVLGSLTCKIHTLIDQGTSRYFASPDRDQMVIEVAHKGQILERLDVRARNAASLEILATAQSQGSIINNSKLPFVGLCQSKTLLIALRYKMEHQMTRRIQMQFGRRDQYDQVLSLLMSANVSFTEAQPKIENLGRPQTAPVSIVRSLSQPLSVHLAPLNSRPEVRGSVTATAPSTTPPSSRTMQFDQQSIHVSGGSNHNSITASAIRGDPYALQPFSAIPPGLPLERIDECQEQMLPPTTTNIRSVYRTGQDGTRANYSTSSDSIVPHATDHSYQTYGSSRYQLDSSPLPPRRELPFSRPQTAPQPSATHGTSSPGVLIPARPLTGKKPGTAVKRALSSVSKASQKPNLEHEASHRSQSMAMATNQRPKTPRSALQDIKSTALNRAAWDGQSVTQESGSPSGFSLESLNGFSVLSETEKKKLLEDIVDLVGPRLTDDFIDFAVCLDASVKARLSLKHMLSDYQD